MAVPKYLPPAECEGHKLGRFEHYKSRIKWLERLDDGNGDEDGSQSYVFRVMIEEKEYAIKVFKFYNPEESKFYWGHYLGDDTSPHVAAWYYDPFYAECRAYGRLQSASGKNNWAQSLAVMCHGFLFLEQRDEEILRQRNVDLGREAADFDYQEDAVWAGRPRAVIKELASSETGICEKSLPQILKHIVRLNRNGILNQDIRMDNFRDGKLIDFGSSWTAPHMVLDALRGLAKSERLLVDRSMFDQMVRDEHIPNPKKVKAIHKMRLRSQKRYQDLTT